MICEFYVYLLSTTNLFTNLITNQLWRTTGTVDTVVVSFFITGSLKMAASIGAVEVVTKMLLYYFHERVWNRINIGREEIKQPRLS